ncbi:MAG TPA: hypothetical protein VG452_05375 [Egibacteraceae bacterium]|nr:hypothetical protein [Egibacteraceae bacterium]
MEGLDAGLPAKRQQHHQTQDPVVVWIQRTSFPLSAELLAAYSKQPAGTFVEHRASFLGGELTRARL